MEHFFQCSECSQHFGAMAAEESAAAVRSTRDALLWSWHAHNIVRLPCYGLFPQPAAHAAATRLCS